jgi:hypothetical protein
VVVVVVEVVVVVVVAAVRWYGQGGRGGGRCRGGEGRRVVERGTRLLLHGNHKLATK